MRAPKQYKIAKLEIADIVNNDYKLDIPDIDAYRERFGYGMGLRLIFNLSGHDKENENVDSVVFVDISNNVRKEVISHLCKNGFILNNTYYMISQRSASMSRNGILSAINSKYIFKFEQALLMDIDTSREYVVSKLCAYLGLAFSACHILEGYMPHIVVIKDYETVVKDQKVFYCKEEEFIDSKTGKTLKRLIPVTEYRDIKTVPFDGTGLHSKKVSLEVREMLDTSESLTTIMWRFPFGKGLTHECDFAGFGAEYGITEITDYWGEKHCLSDVDMIITESMYKGLKFFYEYGDIRDWEKYLFAFKKYGHSFGVAKWNYEADKEPIYTRLNYQIIQDLDVDEQEFISLADKSKQIISEIASGKENVIWNFLGLTYKKKVMHDEMGKEYEKMLPPETDDTYSKAILKNPYCLNDLPVRNHFLGLCRKSIDEMKCGKVYAKASFRMIAPDVVALAEYALGLPVIGCLKAGECFTISESKGTYTGETILERNPHLAKSEHKVLNAVTNEKALKWMGKLYNTVAVNTYDLTLQGLSGADLDGDLALVISAEDCPIIRKGIHTDLPTVINIDEKATAVAELYNEDTKIKNIILTSSPKVGKYSNFNTCYRNKVTDNSKLKERWEEWMNIICIINAKEIDSAKTQVKVRCPAYIEKYAKPLPYFMRYAGDYYAKQKNFNLSHSKMNVLCYDIENWQRDIKWKNPENEFDFKTYILPGFEPDDKICEKLISIYRQYKRSIQKDKNSMAAKKNIWILKEVKKLKKEYETAGKSFNEAKAKKRCRNLYRGDILDFKAYKQKAINDSKAVVSNEQMLANYLVYICYEKIKSADKGYAWQVAGNGIVNNIMAIEHKIPMQVKDNAESEWSYLGRYYKFVPYMYDREGEKDKTERN